MDYIETWKEIMQSPSDFFKEMPKTGGYTDPLTFAAINITIYAFFHLLVAPEEYDLGDFSFPMIVMVAIMIPAIGTIALFIDVTLLYLIQKMLGGKGTYEGTARFVLYSSAAASMLWIPFIGWIFGIYQMYLYIVGGKFIHNMSMERSALAVILFISLILVFLVVLVSFIGFK